MQQRQIPTKEQLEYWYIELNKSRKEIAEMIGYSEAWVHKQLKIYGIKKDKQKRLENVNRALYEKYGVDYPFQNPDIRSMAVVNMKKVYETKEYPNRLSQEELKAHQKQLAIKRALQKKTEKRQQDEEAAISKGISYEEFIKERKEESVRKGRQTILERYGVTSTVMLGLPKRTQEIFSSKESFERYLKNSNFKCIKAICEDLGCAISTLYPRLKKWDLLSAIPKKETGGEFFVRQLLEEEGAFGKKQGKLFLLMN